MVQNNKVDKELEVKKILSGYRLADLDFVCSRICQLFKPKPPVSDEKLREKIIQGVNAILLHNLVRPQPITNYVNPEDIKAYREWLENEIDTQLLALINESQGEPPSEDIKSKEATDIIRGIKDTIRVHPKWGVDKIVELLLFREEARKAIKKIKPSSPSLPFKG